VGRPRFGFSVNVDEKAEIGGSFGFLSFAILSLFTPVLEIMSREMFGSNAQFFRQVILS